MSMHPEPAWYQNPALPIGISILSLFVSLLSFLTSRRATKANVEQRLFERSIQLNEALVRHNVLGPYALRLQIQDDRLEEFTKKAVALLHHINLLREVFQHRRILGKKFVESYEVWADVMIRPWIEEDDELRRVLALFIRSESFVRQDFLEWLKKLFPIFD